MTTRKVLLINGDANVREVVQTCLSHLGGWNVIEASSPSQGLQRAVHDQPDGIVLDLSSSSIDYATFLQKLRAQPATQTIPVVVLTVGAKWLNLKALQPFYVVGAIDYSPDLSQLAQQIAELLGWHRKKQFVETEDYGSQQS